VNCTWKSSKTESSRSAAVDLGTVNSENYFNIDRNTETHHQIYY